MRPWFRATRPAFLTVTILAVALGAAHAWSMGSPLEPGVFFPALLVALLAHAGANVLNDVCDDANGTDALNLERVAPFTGGSRFIQDGTMSAGEMRWLAAALLVAAAALGLVLVVADPRLLVFGLAGLGLAIAYSLPPVALMARGLGEVAVGAAWAVVVAGTAFALAGRFDPQVLWVALPFGLQAMLILLANQVPDQAADRAAGKRNWVVRLGRERAAPICAASLVPAYGIVAAGVLAGALPGLAATVALVLPAQVLAVRQIARHHADSPRLRRPIVLTLASAHLFGVVLFLALVISRLTESP